jgi:hypothetical protein
VMPSRVRMLSQPDGFGIGTLANVDRGVYHERAARGVAERQDHAAPGST